MLSVNQEEVTERGPLWPKIVLCDMMKYIDDEMKKLSFQIVRYRLFRGFQNKLFTATFFHRGAENTSMASEYEAEPGSSKQKDESKQNEDLIPNEGRPL